MFSSFISAGLLCVACSVSEFDSPEALNAYIQSPGNNLTKSVEANGYDIRVTYRPTDLLVYQELEGQTFDSSKVSALRRKYGQYYYFILSLSKDSKEALSVGQGMGQYSELVQTLSFRMQNYVSLTTSSSDTIPLADFMLNRTYGLSRSTEMLLAFDGKNTDGENWLQFNLADFGLGTRSRCFKFFKKDLDRVPHINFVKLIDTNL